MAHMVFMQYTGEGQNQISASYLTQYSRTTQNTHLTSVVNLWLTVETGEFRRSLKMLHETVSKFL